MPSATSTAPEVTEPSPPSLPNAPVPDGTSDVQHRVLYDFEGQAESELTVKKDDLVVIILKENNGWWLTRGANGLGWLPAAYVEEVTTLTPAPAAV